MEIKVGRFPRSVLVIRRVLNRCKVVDFLIRRHNQDPGRVLSGRPFDPGCSLGKAVHLGAPQVLFGIPFVRLHEPVGRLISYSPNRSGPVHVIRPEEDLHVVVRNRLVVPGEVQVDIRHLISLKAQEGFKRNILAVLHQGRPAFRTITVFQVVPGTVFSLGIKLSPLALRATVVRR